MNVCKKPLAFLSIFFVYMLSDAQSVDLSEKISIIAKNSSLESVLNEIEKKSGIKFSYSSQIIDNKQNVTIVARKKPLEDVFQVLFSDLNFDYVLVEKQIVLKKKYTVPKYKFTKKEKAEFYTVSGYLRNEINGEVLIGAGVSILNAYQGTSTNEYGFYSLTLPQGNYVLKFSSIGFEDQYIEIDLHSDQPVSPGLLPYQTEIEIVVITENNNNESLDDDRLKLIKLSEKMITCKTGFAGEANVIKSIQSVPGINSFGEGSVLFYVRGGGKDQNLIMIDDAPVYNPSHLFGFFSAITPDAVNDIKVFKNNFPVKFGGRLSSVIDIRTKDGNLEKWGFSANISPFTGNWSADGPLKKNKSSLFFNLRNSHLNWLFKNENKTFDFHDLHLKFSTKIKQKNRIYFSLYSGKDLLKASIPAFGTSAVSWQNNAFSLRWNKLYSDKLFSNTTLHLGKYDYFLYHNLDENQYWNSFIGNTGFKNDFSFFIKPGNKIDFGVNINLYFFNPGNLNNEYFGRTVYASNASEYVLYAGHDIKMKQKFNLSYGVRIIRWNNYGPSTVFIFDDNFNVSDTIQYTKGSFNNFLNTEPRISIAYQFCRSMSGKIGYDRQIQHLQLLSNSVSPFTTLDIWMPSGLNILPVKSHQISAGIFKFFSETDFSFETYVKSFQNIIEYDNHANLLLNPYIEGELRFGNAYAYGIELSFQKQKGTFNFFSSYTYSRIFNKVASINRGNSYPAKYDKPHNFNLNLSYSAGNRWVLNAGWIYTSGMRFSSPVGFYDYKGYAIPIFEEKNNDRLPDYHRLDIAATLKLNTKKDARFSHELVFAIYNLYGRNNVIDVNFNKIQTENGSFIVPENFIPEKEFISSSKYLSVFMPSISYSIKFR